MGVFSFALIFILVGIALPIDKMSQAKWLMIFPIVLVIMTVVFLVLFFKKDNKEAIINHKNSKKILIGAIIAVSLLSIICSFGTQRAEEQEFRSELKEQANQYTINHSLEKLEADGWIRGASSNTKCPKCGEYMLGSWFDGEIWAKCYNCNK